MQLSIQNINTNNPAYLFVTTQLVGKVLIAFSQIYAIYVFSKIHQPSNAAVIVLLLGYSVWIQIFEFGVSQTLQNGLNSKALRLNGGCTVIVGHYILMVVLAVILIMIPEALDLFQGEVQAYGTQADALAFPIGIALMLVSTNNVLIQRMLLVINKGLVSSRLLIFQATLSISVLSFFQLRGAALLESVVIYLALPLLVHMPLVLKFGVRVWRKKNRKPLNWLWVFKHALGFWGLNALSLIYLGADYFFAANYLVDTDLVSYHLSSRLFFLSFIAYFSYVQYKARNITNDMHYHQILRFVRCGLLIGLLSVAFLLTIALLIEITGVIKYIGASDFFVISLIFSAGLYFAMRVFRDVGLVVIWNLGLKQFLYALHFFEVILCFLLLSAFAPIFGAKGMFFVMAFVATLSSIAIYITLYKILTKNNERSYYAR